MVLYCFMVPVVAGGEKAMREWVAKGIKGNKSHDAVFKAAGITRETVWLQKTPMGDFGAVAFDCQDPGKAMQAISTSTDPWAKQFREFLKKGHGLDFSKPPPLNEAIVDWKA